MSLSGRAGKVVLGMEPENTNAFLQLLFQAATTLSEDQSNAAVQVMNAHVHTSARGHISWILISHVMQEVLASAPPPGAPQETAPPPPPMAAVDLPPQASGGAFSAADFGSKPPPSQPHIEKEPLQMMSAPMKKPEEVRPP